MRGRFGALRTRANCALRNPGRKNRLNKLDDEGEEQNRLISNQLKQLEDAIQPLEEKERKADELEIMNKTMKANIHRLESERDSHNQLRETIALLDEKAKGLERELTKAGPERLGLEKKYSHSLDSLHSEVKAKHQEMSG